MPNDTSQAPSAPRRVGAADFEYEHARIALILHNLIDRARLEGWKSPRSPVARRQQFGSSSASEHHFVGGLHFLTRGVRGGDWGGSAASGCTGFNAWVARPAPSVAH